MYPNGGIAFDWTVLGFGVIGLVAVLSAVAGLLAIREAPHRIARRHERLRHESSVTRAVGASRLPIAAATGVQFALGSGNRRNAAPVRSAIIGATAAIIVVVGTVTFGASLNSLVSHPALYGWNWNYELETPGGGGYIDAHQAVQLLRRDPEVAAWTGVYFDSLRVDGLTVPIIGATPNSPVGPPIVSGHTLRARNQIVLGATTLAELHKRVGETVEARYGTVAKPTRLRIVGTATSPRSGPAWASACPWAPGRWSLTSSCRPTIGIPRAGHRGRRPISSACGPARIRRPRSSPSDESTHPWIRTPMPRRCRCCPRSARQRS